MNEPCKKSPTGYHEPDWKSISVEVDGDTYVDVNCKHCGMSGCVGNEKTLLADINWE